MKTVVFDLGGVLIDWNPRYLYRKLMNETDMEWFLENVCHSHWNEQQDSGRTFAEAIEDATRMYPQHAWLIRTYFERWGEMLGGALNETVEVLNQLHTQQVPLYALSNWSAETFHHAERKFDFLNLFRGKIVSGFEGVKKPDPRIYEILLTRFNLKPQSTFFVDDVLKNVETARNLGIYAVQFTNAKNLQLDLEEFLKK